MKIFVSNINFNVREPELSDLFSQFGEVISVKIIKDTETRKSKGYGFIQMATSEQATAAINALHGAMHFYRSLIVTEAKGRKEPVAN